MSPRREILTLTAVAFAVALVAFGVLFSRFPVLYDTDSYYHLAVARAYADRGLIDDLPWARMSLMHRGFGDKEWLFHVLLAPVAGLPSSAAGAWALALLNAGLVAVLAGLGMAALGRRGLVLPVLAYAGSLELLGRVIRLRPELLGLLLLLAAAVCAGRRRYRLLGAVALAYASSYTAFQALLGLCGAWFVQRGWARRRWEWRLVLYPLVGVGLALVVHPHFPHNLLIWKVQNVDFFQQKHALDVGPEIRPQTADQVLELNLVWALGLLVLWRAGRRRRTPGAEAPATDTTSDMADVFLVAAGAFGILYLLMLRFSIYFVPFATLAVAYELRRRGGLGRTVALPWRGRIPLSLALAALLVLGSWPAGRLLIGLATATPERGPSRLDDWAAFGRAVPVGARVAADWGSTHLYMYWAPQASYLNVLDPVFMAVPYPEGYAALRAVLESREADVPRALRRSLASDFLALSRFHQPQELLARLAADPRLRLRYGGYTLLYEVVEDANRDFVLDWRSVPAGRSLPPADPDEVRRWPVWPRSAEPGVRAVEGYVDASRLSSRRDEGCAAFVHLEEVGGPDTGTYEIASYGPVTVWVDDDLAVASRTAGRAILGAGIRFPVRREPGTHRLTVLTCPGIQAGRAESGFYLRRAE